MFSGSSKQSIVYNIHIHNIIPSQKFYKKVEQLIVQVHLHR